MITTVSHPELHRPWPINGEGLIGLTRGFMYAGARRVVVSLWEVNDNSTAELIQQFYQRLPGEKDL